MKRVPRNKLVSDSLFADPPILIEPKKASWTKTASGWVSRNSRWVISHAPTPSLSFQLACDGQPVSVLFDTVTQAQEYVERVAPHALLSRAERNAATLIVATSRLAARIAEGDETGAIEALDYVLWAAKKLDSRAVNTAMGR